MSPGFVWTDRAVREALDLEASPGALDLRFGAVSTDTRTVRPGDLFVALEGERLDGHDFLLDAEAAGAAGAVVTSEPMTTPGLPLYRVPDTLVGLGRLARYRRRSLAARVIGITGSTGKTTVKELLGAALGGSFKVYATPGNLNNRVGVPLSLLGAPDDAEFLVIELGTSEPGEIGALTAIAEPDHGLVTTVGEAHLTGLGSLEGIMDEKLDLIRGTDPEGVVLVGDEPEALVAAARRARPDVHVAGLSASADSEFRGELLDQDAGGRYRVRFRGNDVRAGIPGRHGAWNLTVSLAMAVLLGADLAEAAEDAGRIGPGRLRGEVRPIGGRTLILDCYNANPQSVAGALDSLAGLPGGGAKIAILGSMLELGGRSAALHTEVLRRATALPIDVVVATGEFAGVAGRFADDETSVRMIAVEAIGDAYEAARPLFSPGARILLKGSRGVALERLVERFESDFESPGTGEARRAGTGANPGGEGEKEA